MFPEEAKWIAEALRRDGLGPGASVLDVGSSTEAFRLLHQPYIDYLVFRPLREAGARIIHLDAKEDEGVDVVCDLTDPDSRPRVDELGQFDAVICCNMLEHVTARDLVIARLRALTKEGGLLLVTAPRVYRYHPDPIDTGYRPTPAELRRDVADGWELVDAAVLETARSPADDVPVRRVWLLLPYGLFRLWQELKRRRENSTSWKTAAVGLRKPAA